ncbi:BMP family ABC transporter substrate-binding protein [Desertibacillus haloalkaliphilus]|nr:BMP family ABC transporter substrate-binding protein [Desertibacillus haloalkaliphilus]
MNRVFRGLILSFILFMITACSNSQIAMTDSSLQKVGLLLEDTIDDQGWNSKGYQGLLNIQSTLGVDVYFKESVNSSEGVKTAVEEFDSDGVNLIFGHGRMFADLFSDIQGQYPDIHFVSFNGYVEGENITSLHFDGHAMGFFGGMVAGKMSESNRIGVIAAFPWQPEVGGFIDGVGYENNNAEVFVEYVYDWADVDQALINYEQMVNEGVDVFYPAGDGFHVPIVEEVKQDGLHVLGFVSDQSDLGETTVLTSTVQHVDDLYQLVAERFNHGELQSGNIYYDFQDGVITLGEFSSLVPTDFQEEVKDYVQEYIETNELPSHH